MVIDLINTLDKYRGIYPCISEVADWIKTNRFNTELGKHEVEGSSWFYINLEYDTKQYFEDLVFEAHRKFLDVHIVISGIEKVHWLPIDQANSSNDYQDEGDYQLFQAKGELCNSLTLGDNNFLMLEPNEVHATGFWSSSKQVKKRVIKIPLVNA